jgi:hypothetical protein
MSNLPQNQDSLGEKLKATDSNKSDTIYNASKAFGSLIPAVGPLAEFFIDTYIGPPATKRMRSFLNSLVEELYEVKSKIELVNFENPVFQTTFMQACQIAARTHQEQKLEALRNVVLNSSIPSSLEDDILAMFLNWIDGFNALHVSTLKHLHYLDRYALKELEIDFPMLEQKRAVYNQVLKDLANRGLINLEENYTTKEDANGDIALQRLGFSRTSIPLGVDHITQRSGRKERELKTVRRQEDIDKLLRMNRLCKQASKTTELGKQFIEFMEYPSIQTGSM